jgi:hypothetical protein
VINMLKRLRNVPTWVTALVLLVVILGIGLPLGGGFVVVMAAIVAAAAAFAIGIPRRKIKA